MLSKEMYDSSGNFENTSWRSQMWTDGILFQQNLRPSEGRETEPFGLLRSRAQ